MKKYEEHFLKLLNHSIKDTTLDNIEESFQWDKIYEEAKVHNVEGLIYSAIGKNQLIKTLDKDLLNEWTKKTIFSSVIQKKHIDEICKVFDAFNKANIPVIALKGLVIRNLYPKPDLRTMGDADLLINEKDMVKADNLLKNLNYQTDTTLKPNVDIKYLKSGCLPIELHWKLINTNYFNGNLVEFENTIWDNIKNSKILGASAFILDYETEVLYMCIHMAKHLACSGFGFRHVCDLALFIDKNFSYIDWDVFIKKSKKYGVFKFSTIMLLLCNKLFYTNLPKGISYTSTDNKNLDLLISEIFESGTFGNRNISKLITTQLAFTKIKSDISESKSENSSFSKFLRVLFLSKSSLSSIYSYLNKYPFLLPVAWIHHTTYRIFDSSSSLAEKSKLLFGWFYLSKKRSTIINWLEI